MTDLVIDFVSDLHMEINGHNYLEMLPFEDGKKHVLLLLGDISCFRFFRPIRTDPEARGMRNRFSKMITDKFGDYFEIYYVPGNHEYYNLYLNHAVDELIPLFRDIDPRLELCNERIITFDDVAIILTTLWTDCDGGNPIAKNAVQNGMNDFRIIAKEQGGQYPITADDMIEEHRKNFNFIKTAVDVCEGKRIIIGTHHGPSLMSHDEKRFGVNDLMQYGYLTDLSEYILDHPQIECWIHGHTHSNVEYQIGSCRITSAMYGYDYYDRAPKSTLQMGRIVL